MNATQTLERAAIDSHRQGKSWAQFWQQHADDIRIAEPHNIVKFRRLVGRLLSIVVSGDDANTEPIDSPWGTDDFQPEPAPTDVGTKARCLLPIMRIGVLNAERLEVAR